MKPPPNRLFLAARLVIFSVFAVSTVAFSHAAPFRQTNTFETNQLTLPAAIRAIRLELGNRSKKLSKPILPIGVELLDRVDFAVFCSYGDLRHGTLAGGFFWTDEERSKGGKYWFVRFRPDEGNPIMFAVLPDGKCSQLGSLSTN